jgi:hypothetical protein
MEQATEPVALYSVPGTFASPLVGLTSGAPQAESMSKSAPAPIMESDLFIICFSFEN